jgi:CRP/FNR family cyclic AMP-dependent transcriptional regulator
MEPESLGRALQGHPAVAALKPEHLDFLAGCTKNVRFTEGEYLFREGSDASQLYLVRQGKVAIEIYAPPRGAMVLETLHAGDAIGWSVLFPPHAWHADARALRDTLVFAIDGECLRNKLEADHEFGYAFMRAIVVQLHRRLERARLQQLDVYRAE